MSKTNNVVIIGGGTAGWMSANILAYSFKDQPVNLTLIESDTVPRIGVGEGSTPALKVFFDKLGIAESEWMPACSATYKCGITFADWSSKPGYERYFHPFASAIDAQNSAAFIAHANQRLSGAPIDVHPNRYFLAAYLAEARLAPIPDYNFPFELAYGYHFDAELLGNFLKNHAVKRGVRHLKNTVGNVERGDTGDVEAIVLDTGERLAGDMFLDCTGFASLIAEKALNTPYVSYKDLLFNDAAVALASESETTLPSETVSTAMQHGWAWRIPLQHRFGNGYVYSSSHCSADAAETELRQRLGLLNSEVTARHLKMRVGRLENSWNHNVLAVGLSQGFIEPLEATALLLVQQTVALFAHYYLKANYATDHQREFNQQINDQFDRTRDYIVTHYQTNSREDTDYWRDARSNRELLSPSLKQLYACWMGGNEMESEIRRQGIQSYYPVSSWYCLMVGVGLVPNDKQSLRAPSHLSRIVDFNSRCAMNFKSHTKQLKQVT